MQGKLINNKKENLVINAINFSWNWDVGKPLVRFFADNGTEIYKGVQKLA